MNHKTGLVHSRTGIPAFQFRREAVFFFIFEQLSKCMFLIPAVETAV
jgi:hypothetical protein